MINLVSFFIDRIKSLNFFFNVYVLVYMALTASQPVLCYANESTAHENITHCDLNKKNVTESENVNRFLQKYKEFKVIDLEDIPVVVSYISIIFMGTIQHALENAKIQTEIAETRKLISMVPRLESLNYTVEDLIKIAAVLDEYQKSIAMRKPIDHASRNAYDQLYILLVNAQEKDKKEFISKLLKNRSIAKVVAYGVLSVVSIFFCWI